jgi:hypothetical protein
MAVYSDQMLIGWLRERKAIPTTSWHNMSEGAYGIQSPELVRTAVALRTLLNAGVPKVHAGDS